MNWLSPKITVIMPSLNVQKYIKGCMESVLCQTLSDIEILAIDGGSTDGTLEILKDYEKKDERITVILSEKKSYGYQVNKGIALAKGKYIGVVETDDWILPDMYEILYDVAQDTESDYVKGTVNGFWDNLIGDNIRCDIKFFPQEQYNMSQGKIVLTPNEHPELVLLDYYLWNGIYNKILLKNIRLNETNGAAYQDIGFLIQTQYKANRAVYLDRIVYNYRKDNANSSCYNPKAFHYLAEEYAYVDKLMNGKEKEWITAYHYKMFRQVDIRFRTMAESGSFWEEALPDICLLTEKIRTALHEGILKRSDLTDIEWKAAECLLEDPYALYNTYAEPIQRKIRMLHELAEGVRGQDIIIFGCGRWGKFFHMLCEHKGYGKIMAYCDNQCEEQCVQGLPVIKPEKAVKKYPNAYYVIANKYSAQELRTQLRSLGVEDERILEYTIGIDMQMLNIR